MATLYPYLTKSDFSMLEVKRLVRIIQGRISSYELIVALGSQVQVYVLQSHPLYSPEILQQPCVPLLRLVASRDNLRVLFELQVHVNQSQLVVQN